MRVYAVENVNNNVYGNVPLNLFINVLFPISSCFLISETPFFNSNHDCGF